MNGLFLNLNRGQYNITTRKPGGFIDGDLWDLQHCEGEKITCCLSDSKDAYFRDLGRKLESDTSLSLQDVLDEHDEFASDAERLTIFERISSVSDYSLETFRDEQRDFLAAYNRA